jgi:hypothetical protein
MNDSGHDSVAKNELYHEVGPSPIADVERAGCH